MNETQYVKKINGYLVKDSEARSDLESLNTSVDNIQESLDTAVENINTINGTLTNVQNDITTINETTRGLGIDIHNLNDRANYHDSELNNINNKSYYSTTEKVVGKWINNKPLYRKTTVIELSTEHATNTIFSSGIEDIETLVECNAVLERDRYVFMLPEFESSEFNFVIKLNGTNYLITNTGVTGTAYITSYYTKSTDVAE